PHLDVGFIQAPARIKATPPEPAQPLLHLRGVALDPAIDRRMVDRNAAFRQHFLKVAIADRIATIPAHRPQDHITLEMAPLEIRHRSVRPISAKHAQASRFLQQSRTKDPAVLVLMGGVIYQRDRRYWHLGKCRPDDSRLLPGYYGCRCRRFRRHFVAGQYGRPIRMVDHLGLHWPQKHLPGLSRGGHHPILAHRFLWWQFDCAVYYRGDLYSVVLRWRFLHGSGLSEGYVRCVPGWCHSRTTIDRLVRRRYCWAP